LVTAELRISPVEYKPEITTTGSIFPVEDGNDSEDADDSVASGDGTTISTGENCIAHDGTVINPGKIYKDESCGPIYACGLSGELIRCS